LSYVRKISHESIIEHIAETKAQTMVLFVRAFPVVGMLRGTTPVIKLIFWCIAVIGMLRYSPVEVLPRIIFIFCWFTVIGMLRMTTPWVKLVFSHFSSVLPMAQAGPADQQPSLRTGESTAQHQDGAMDSSIPPINSRDHQQIGMVGGE